MSIIRNGLTSLIDQPLEFPPSIVDRLKIVADTTGTTMHRIRAEKISDEQLKFEDLISKLSATFIHIKASEIDKNIERGLQLVVEFLDIQRGNLFLEPYRTAKRSKCGERVPYATGDQIRFSISVSGSKLSVWRHYLLIIEKRVTMVR